MTTRAWSGHRGGVSRRRGRPVAGRGRRRGEGRWQVAGAGRRRGGVGRGGVVLDRPVEGRVGGGARRGDAVAVEQGRRARLGAGERGARARRSMAARASASGETRRRGEKNMDRTWKAAEYRGLTPRSMAPTP